MGRTLKTVIAVLAVAVCFFANSSNTFAQQQNSTDQAPQVRTPISQEMRRVLEFWERSSGQIKKLRGTHHRIVFNHTYKTEMQSQGLFYYEGPDKGRMDIEPVKIPEGAQSRKIDPQTNKPYQLSADRAEKWVCNGKLIWEIDEDEKVATQISVPESHQGQNIMEGPLPFLFGMPAEMAEKRYELRFIKPLAEDPNFIWLEIKPRWKQDSATWQMARLRLDKKKFLPSAVQMIEPGGNMETTYEFEDLVVNGFDMPWKDPFEPKLRGYKLNIQSAEQPQAASVVPSVLGLHGKNAKDVIEKSGYVVVFRRGTLPPNAKLKHVVYEQLPQPKSELEKGEKVQLTIYTPAETASSK